MSDSNRLQQAIKALSEIANNPGRPEWMRKEATGGLVQAGAASELAQIANNPTRPHWMRKEAMQGLTGLASGGHEVTLTQAEIDAVIQIQARINQTTIKSR